MIPGPFAYHRAGSVAEALALLAEHGDEAKLLAGGQSLIPLMRFRLANPAVLIDINPIAALRGLRLEDGDLVIGALTREVELERSPLVGERYPLLADAAAVIADPLVRNLATVGGNLAHADPANDHPAAMIASGRCCTSPGPSGERVIPVDDFFVDTFTTALAPDELLTAIRLPAPPPRSGGAYVKFERKVGDYAIAAAAAHLSLRRGRHGRPGRPQRHQRRAVAVPRRRGRGGARRPAVDRGDYPRGRRAGRRRRRAGRATCAARPTTSGR